MFLNSKYYSDEAITLPYLADITLGMSLDTEEKINSFTALPDGWDYGSGGPLPQETANLAVLWNNFLRFVSTGLLATNAGPGSDGEIAIGASLGDHYIGVIIEPDHTVSVMYDVDHTPKFYRPRLSNAAAQQAVYDAWGQIVGGSA